MIIQDARGGAVLSLFYANMEAIEKMNQEGYVWRYSRKLGRIIKKGETSGNFQKVISIQNDCDSDALLVKVKPSGPACHTNAYSCFGETIPILTELTDVISERKQSKSQHSYVSGIVNDRMATVAKLREELDELICAGKKSEVVWEAADLLFFMLVYLENRGIELNEVLGELRRRRK
jgi:phosphoribosyl-ATP pyrophosphohydrolase/phosphoribosyl-AMP cyclohydrolase